VTPKSDFERVIAALDPAMVIVTAAAGGERAGCLVGFHAQTSIDPARYLVCISDKNRTRKVAGDSPVLAVHVVPDDRRDLAELFGGETGDEVDKFERCAWSEGPDGVPLLDDCPTRFAGRVRSVHDVGDHAGFVLEPVAGAGEGEGEEPLRLDEAEEIEPGHDA
jgi:flavin reductase (DIM6/NTAB) family NADH-FMN oxidoreductase RutF